MALPIDPHHEPYHQARDPEEEILEIAANLEVPEGYRVQVIDGRITVTPPADGDHAVALTALVATLLATGPRERGLHVVQGLGCTSVRGRGASPSPTWPLSTRTSGTPHCRTTATRPSSSSSSPR